MENKKIKFINDVYMNREYSWLMFNKRVLDQATDTTNPLLERCKFLSIFHSNFDEFFMVRVGSLLNDAKMNASAKDNKTELTAREQVDGVLKLAKDYYRAADGVYVKLKKELSKSGLRIKTGAELSAKQYAKCKQYFEAQVLPLLSPMVLDAKHPMIRFENMKTYMMFELTKSDRLMYGVMSISPRLPRVYHIEGGKKTNVITVEELIRTFGAGAFDGYKIQSQAMLRLTRNADFDANIDDADIERDFDFSKFLKHKVELRGTQDAVRLQIDDGADNIKAFVLKILDLKKQFCFTVGHGFDYKFLMSLGGYLPQDELPALKYKPPRPLAPPVPHGESVLEAALHSDIFLAYPFDSMDTLVRLLDECATDKRVASIKITIYRLDHRSRIVEALKKASENGKEVTVVIELCARFDEENNLYFSEVLKDAGCTIIYGMGNYKVHSKIISIVLSDGEKIKYVTHLGTGNYNEQTSKLYTDLNIITSDDAIGRDAVAFFRNIAICNTDHAYEKLLIAPKYLKSGLIKFIERETEKAKAGLPAFISAKMNSLTDKTIIDKLISASKAGVRIKLVVRGICCLVPGIKGKTENISVVSIVGRLLEHSRIYCFGSENDRTLFISSADLMTRNTDKRVEIATPVIDTKIADKIYGMLEVMLKDNVKARRLTAEGTYVLPEMKGDPINSQEMFLKGKFEL
ncbi:MAG: polyphosphate kinase 1 [Clostridiales bacterium]|nr:polyphosphate kinase 1 [Clostridiales bacterium]